jgi:hypothetical protein
MAMTEKIPDAPRREVAYAGVAISSRYGRRHELETMMAALDYFADRDPAMLALIAGISCDSQACAVYEVKCRCATGSSEWAPAIAEMLDRALRDVAGGHNGITVQAGGQCTEIDPGWKPADDLAQRVSDLVLNASIEEAQQEAVFWSVVLDLAQSRLAP